MIQESPFDSLKAKRFFSFPKCPDRTGVHSAFYPKATRDLSPVVKWRGLNLSTYFNLVLSLIMCGAISPLPLTSKHHRNVFIVHLRPQELASIDISLQSLNSMSHSQIRGVILSSGRVLILLHGVQNFLYFPPAPPPLVFLSL